jgi:O-antigen ligase
MLLGQAVSLVALALCIVGFASKRDDRLFVLLLFANVAFAAQFALFGSWVAAGISALIVLRIALVRRFRRNLAIILGMLARAHHRVKREYAVLGRTAAHCLSHHNLLPVSFGDAIAP